MFSNGYLIATASKYINRLSRNPLISYQRLSTKALNINHDIKNQIFYIKSNSQIAKIDYNQKDDIITILHTIVPKEFQGKGVGKQLAKTILKYVEENKLKMKIECSFIKNYVENEAPQYKKFIKN